MTTEGIVELFRYHMKHEVECKVFAQEIIAHKLTLNESMISPFLDQIKTVLVSLQLFIAAGDRDVTKGMLMFPEELRISDKLSLINEQRATEINDDRKTFRLLETWVVTENAILLP